MAITRNPVLTIPVRTYSHYTECEPWCLSNVGEWNVAWWKDFADIAARVNATGPHEDCYWFANEKDAVMFRLKWL